MNSQHTARASMQPVIARPPGLAPFRFFVHEGVDRFISERIRRTGRWEPFESGLLLNLLGPGDQVIDVGANIGWYSVSSALRVGETGHVFAFEPDAANFALLSANVAAAKVRWVSAERAALGRSTGTAAIEHSPDNQGDHRVRSFVSGEAGKMDSTRDIPVLALDSYLANQKALQPDRLRIIKIDVQGFENEVLLGAQKLLARLPARTILFMEFDPLLLHDHDPTASRELIDTLDSLGRQIFAISRPIWRLKRVLAADLRHAARSDNPRSFDLIIVDRQLTAEVHGALPAIPRFLSWAGRGL